MDLTQMSVSDLEEYYYEFLELNRLKLAERVKKEIDRRNAIIPEQNTKKF